MIDWGALAARVSPVLGFLVAITVVAELADAAGVFDVAARRAARMARGRVIVLWALVVGLATLSTIVLSLDTTAVLLTPVVLSVARRARLDVMPFAFVCVWLANTASLLLPVSNLTNLLAFRHFPGTVSYAAQLWAPAVAAIIATVVVAWLLFRRQLRGTFEPDASGAEHDRPLLAVSMSVCLLLGPCFVAGVTPWIAATAGGVILLVVTAARSPGTLRHLQLPWKMVVFAAVLFVLAEFVDVHGGRTALTHVLGGGTGPWDLARVTAVAGVAANAINNLPAYLALDSATGPAGQRIAALLVGVNVLPVILPWGSLATLLWHDRCRRAEVSIPWGRYVPMSAAVAVVAGAAAWLSVAFL